MWRIYTLLGLDYSDLIAFVLCDLLGVLVVFVLPRPWVPYGSVFISYHLFLAWLLFNNDRKTDTSLPILSTTLTHLACFVLVISLTIGWNVGSFPRPLGFCIAALAVFERFWLFSGRTKVMVTQVAAPITTTVAEATADDHAEWLQFVARQPRPFPRPGTTLQSEYERWLVARAKSRAKAS